MVTSDNGTLIGSTKYHPFGDRRNSQGDLGTDKLFTGQRLDETGLYYYGARYYDATIGRFISPDNIITSIMNPQSLNRYTYVLNNPLKYNDPTGNWPSWSSIISTVRSAISSFTSSVSSTVSSTVSSVKSSISSTASSVTSSISSTVSSVSSVTSTVSSTVSSVSQSVVSTVQSFASTGSSWVQTTSSSVAQTVQSSVGVEGTSSMSTSLVNNVRVIDVKQGSFLDMLPDTVTLYPVGVFTNRTMDPITQEEEGFHWQDQSQRGALVVGWYAQYIGKYALNLAAYGGNTYLAHNAVSFERTAMAYAAQAVGKNYSHPPSPWQYWRNRLFP